MKVIISDGKLNFVVDSVEKSEYILKACKNGVIVKDAVNGLNVIGDKGKLFDVLQAVSAKYDIDLV